jgi:hypothetical protein
MVRPTPDLAESEGGRRPDQALNVPTPDWDAYPAVVMLPKWAGARGG